MSIKKIILIALFNSAIIYTNGQERNVSLNLNGFYYTIERNGGDIYLGKFDVVRFYLIYMFFYIDGSFAFIGGYDLGKDSILPRDYFYNKRDSMIKVFSNKSVFTWGFYKVNTDTIYITKFARKQSGLSSRGKWEMFAKIKDINTILLFGECCKWCKSEAIQFKNNIFLAHDPPIEYKFFPYLPKPDSSWFRKRAVYKREIKKAESQ